MAAHWDRLEETSTAVSNAVSFFSSTSIFYLQFGRVLKNVEEDCAGHEFLGLGIAFWEVLEPWAYIFV